MPFASRASAFAPPPCGAAPGGVEDKVLEAYGKVIVEIKCKAGAGGTVNLGLKMLRPCHVEALFAAVNKYEVKGLNLNGNQLGDAGAEAIAAMLRTNRSLTFLDLERNKIGDAGAEAIAAMLRTNRSLTELWLRNEIGDAGKKALREAVAGREGFKLEV